MLLFMEYCSEGTVAEAAKLGLGEDLIRKYTCEILYAISVLHDNQIVHRDIKGTLFSFKISSVQCSKECCWTTNASTKNRDSL